MDSNELGVNFIDLVKTMTELTVEMRGVQSHLKDLSEELKNTRLKLINDHSTLSARVEALEKGWNEKKTIEKTHLVWLKRIGITITCIGGFLGWMFNFFHGKLLLQWLTSFTK